MGQYYSDIFFGNVAIIVKVISSEILAKKSYMSNTSFDFDSNLEKYTLNIAWMNSF